MMEPLRKLALYFCILCTATGTLRIFLPENSWQPVINRMAALYILAAVLSVVGRLNWQEMEIVLRQWSAAGATAADYSSDAENLAIASAQAAIEQLLESAGIDARAEVQAGCCRVTLRAGADRAEAEKLLATYCTEMPLEIYMEDTG